MSDNIPSKDVGAGLSEGIAKCAVTCPMCGLRHVQYRLNPTLYWFADAEMDRKPSGFHCRKSLEGYYPPLYEAWHCPQCHFTANNRVFPDPLKHVYIEKGMVSRRLDEMRKSDPAMVRITETLGANASFEKADFVQAIQLALLEIYFLKILVDILNQGHDSLARSYLRLAWLFRDWYAMRSDRAEEEARLAKAQDVIAQDWVDCPRTENDALEAACKWFGISLARSNANQDPVETCSAMLQVARIRVKMGALDAARKQLSECQWSLVNDLESITRAMNDDLRQGKLSEEQRGRMLTDSRKLRSMIEECRTLLEPINKKLEADNRKRAEALVAANSKMQASALRNLLEENGISAAMARELVPDKKESRFGGLFR